MPFMPSFNDTPTAHNFYSSLTGLIKPGMPSVPVHVDEKMFMTFGLGVMHAYLIRPSATSNCLAHFNGVQGIYTRDFPDKPPLVFDYTNNALNVSLPLILTTTGTKLKRLKYNSVVEIVLQNTALIGAESHPLHLHGSISLCWPRVSGNYNEGSAQKMFNLVHPVVRNTIAVPVGGWAVIRFRADNPVCVWLMHCHLDVHLPTGLAMAFEVGMDLHLIQRSLHHLQTSLPAS
ncbi:putative laccase [Dioscorea sansibarensis]